MKILISGASGFIGKYVISELDKQKKHQIIATARDSFEKVENFEWSKNIEYINQDLNELKDNYFTFFKKPDLLIHLSWEGLPNYKELFHIERNLMSNYLFIKNMVNNGLKNLSVIGTCLEYGMREGCLSESMITDPIVPYAIAKDTLRKFIEQLKKKFNFYFKWIRLFYVYGKGQNPNSLLPQLNQALNNNKEVFNMSPGDQIRDYLPIEKAAEYIIKISLQNEILGVINCCSGKPISIKQFVEEYLKKKNRTIKLNLGYYDYPNYEPMSFWGDTDKLNSIISNKKIEI